MKQVFIPLVLLILGPLACKSLRTDQEGGAPGRGADSGMQMETDQVMVRETWEPKTFNDVPPELANAKPMESQGSGLNLAAGVVTNTLNVNDELKLGQSLVSPDGRFTLVFQQDSNLVMYYHTRAIWASNTVGRGASQVIFQPDGNLVMYTATKGVIWSPNTYGRGGQAARLTDNGNFAVYTGTGAILWQTGTGRYPPATATDTRPIAIGKFGTQIGWPIIPIHTVMMPTGKVFNFGTNGDGVQGAQFNYDIWTPAGNIHQTLPNQIGTDIFCGAPIIIPANGNILIPGGDARPSGNTNAGIKDTLILNKDTQTLSRGPYLANGRWYETATTLANGEIMVHGGIDGGRVAITVPEIYSPATGAWRSLMGAANGAIINGGEAKWWYPRNWVAPDGRIFGMSGEQMYYINTAGNGTSQVVGTVPGAARSYYSSAVMYQPGKILQLGGNINGGFGQRGSDGAIHVDINGATPVTKTLNPMAYERIWGSATVLPSGEVLVTGGSPFDNQEQEAALVAEMWNPTTQLFRPLAKAVTPRLYHSTSLLLQDGTVLIAGGGAPGPRINKNAEIYSPPYLFTTTGTAAPRPVIGRATSREDYGHVSNISWSGTGPVSKVVLIKTGAVTHSFDMEQRFIPLNFTVNANTVNVTMPANANLAPPGYYFLFLMNSAGVPSVAKIVSLGVPRERNTLLPGDVLSVNDKLTSPDGRTVLSFKPDGNLVILFQGQQIWQTNTAGRGAVKATMQDDGNLVVYTATNAAVWASGTYGAQYAGGRLVMQNDANLVIYKGTQPYWASNTCCR